MADYNDIFTCILKIWGEYKLLDVFLVYIYSVDFNYEHFGPGVLACATRGGGRTEAGHCFHLEDICKKKKRF